MKKLNFFFIAVITVLTLLSASNCNGNSNNPDDKEDPIDNPDPVTPPDPVIQDGTVKLYSAPAGLPANVKGVRHSVSINGQECFVYRTEATGGGIEYGQVYPEYVYFDFEEEGRIAIDVTANYDLSSVDNLPRHVSMKP